MSDLNVAVAQPISSVRTLATALAAVIVATVVSLVIFFVAGGLFGPINDVGNALIGLLAAVLAIQLSGRVAVIPRSIGTALAILGVAVAAWGSWLVISGSTGFLFAGFVTTVGLGLIGVLLALVCWSPTADKWPGAMRTLGRAAATLMVAGGIAAVPGLFATADTYDELPLYLWLFSLGWLGVYVLLPIWSYRIGRSAG